jgi:hypothetical protein
MRESPRPSYQVLPFDLACEVDDACCRFEGAWKTAEIAGKRPCLDDYLNSIPEPGRPALLGELVALDIAYRRRGGEDPPRSDSPLCAASVASHFRNPSSSIASTCNAAGQ